MGKRKYQFDEAKYARFLRDGKGQGNGPTYRPFLTVSDVSSRGRSHRVFCPLTQREHHFLSDNEFYAFHLCWWNERLLDLREQYPLPRADTLSIAAGLGIRHPVDPHSRTPLIQTTDLLLTVDDGDGPRLKARAVKALDDARSERTLEKLEIERQYWVSRGIDWDIMLDFEVKTTFARNIVWARGALQERLADPRAIGEALMAFLGRQGDAPAFNACRAFDRSHGFPDGHGMSLLRLLIGLRWVETDMNAAKLFRRPASAFLWRAKTGSGSALPLACAGRIA